jgi:putative ABC transport system permease protein
MNNLLASFRFSLRNLRRGWRSGELLILIVALALAVGAASSVSLFTDRVRQAVVAQSGETIAADLLLSLRSPVGEKYTALAKKYRLSISQTAVFPSVALADEETALVAAKAVDQQYPLRGQLLIQRAGDGAPVSLAHGPERGEVWVEQSVLTQLSVSLGDDVELGDSVFVVDAVLLSEPDRGSSFANIAPRVMMNYQDLAATGLVSVGSRADYKVLLAGDNEDITAFDAELRPNLAIGERLETPQQARPALKSALSRGEIFLDLAALVTVIMAGVAIALAAQQHARRQFAEIALIKTLGAQKGFLLATLLWQLVLTGLVGCLLGLSLGVVGQALISNILASGFDVAFPSPHWSAVAPALITGFVVLLGFAWPALSAVRHAPPAAVFRQTLTSSVGSKRVFTLIALASVIALVVWQTGNLKLAAAVLGGTGVAIGLMWLGAAAMIRSLRFLLQRRAGRQAAGALRFGINSVVRHPQASQTTVVAFGSSLMLLFLLLLVRADLLGSWNQQLDDSVPNHFLINIANDQVVELDSYLVGQGITGFQFYPMVRARLIDVDGVEGNGENFPEAESMFRREMNLSWLEQMNPDNKLLEGDWWTADDVGKPLVSIESSVQRRLGLQLGDSLSFDIAGEQFSVTVASIREVKWDSLSANFYLLFPPKFLEQYPMTLISAIRLDDTEQRSVEEVSAGLIQAFPNVSMINLNVIMDQIKRIASRVSQAIELVFSFTLAAGVLVLLSVLQGTRNERRQETAVLRTLGANTRLLLGAQWVEFLLIGVLAAFLATLMAQLVALPVAELLDLPYQVNLARWLFFIALATISIALVGSLSLRDVLKQSPIASLR